jgi:hypothetical protein
MSFLLILLALQMPGRKPTPTPVCHHIDGSIDGPVVPTPDIARAIFSAIAKGRSVRSPMAGYKLATEDNGASWLVYQMPDDTNIRGGGLMMRINKCTGAISEIHYMR